MTALKRRFRLAPQNLGLLGLLVLVIASCANPPKRQVVQKAEYQQTGFQKPSLTWEQTDLPVMRVEQPSIAEAEYVDDDELCMTCHETYVTTFAHNVHRGQKCEDCHGPASRHLSTRGKEPGTILSFKTLHPSASSELCLKCHEHDACAPGATWRTSVHAHQGVGCTHCHNAHYNVPPGTPPTTIASAEDVIPITFEEDLVVRGQDADTAEDSGAPAALPSLRGTSRALNAVAPQVCYRCHQETYQLQAIAHPHQIGGEHGFNCTTCHDPHGKILEYSRKEMCLKCHDGSPTAAWHSSTHDMYGVACTDCHNPHPETQVPDVVNISHTQIARPKRLPMSVNDPVVCYKCHADIYAMNSMPSHHPIKEGKMVCSDCHDSHGQQLGNLKEPTLNMVCYKCHADKQGPFVYEHPPVTENCGICHNPHGTVANNLLHQPTTFLCLRCHTGHRTGPTFGPHTGSGLADVGVTPDLQRAFYGDCSQCHSQIHGSDLPSPHNAHAFVR